MGITQNQRIAIFDFDGTLCDSLKTAFVVLNGLSDDFGFKKIESSEVASLKNMGTLALVHHFGIPMYRLPALVRRFRQDLQSRMPDLKPFPRIPETIARLSDAGVVLGLLTTNSEDNVRGFLKQHGMDRFEFVAASSSIFGKSRSIRKLLHARGFQPASVSYIGDEARDVQAAKKAGVRSVSVSWGFHSIQALEREKPDALVHAPDELVAVLTRS